MGQLLSQPLNDKLIQYKEYEKFSYCLGSMQGYRLTQEDAHSINYESNLQFQNLINDSIEPIDLKIYGIYDGHGGSQSSNYISEHLPQEIINQFKFQPIDIDNKNTSYKTIQGLLISKFKNAFLKTDYNLFKFFQQENNNNNNNSCLNSGSTAIMGIIINNKELYCLNTGDSRIITSINGIAKNLSFDHKPNHIGELIRINDAGGSVSFNRVGGILALSRAFGDFNFKLRKFRNQSIDSSFEDQILNSEETQVTVEPEIIIHKISPNDEFIILACDGIWDCFNNQDLINYIRNQLVKGLKLNEITSILLEYTLSLANQSTGIGFDNMSLIIIACQLDNESIDQWYERLKLKIEIEKGIV
ncbi:putative protein phosphatase [Wickerhamomyces ciferrii]|uniref:protein-serine/threonine phosphatase n=1 Tax=Wickerhamomyces ciferrii (strain ATCC 14091 / BCRC 22168 / CBS 111 / JCM 3599 / NBRC 0793 / NRRL Y-1031 F-60-10) TaxID=1206466 RepID=K0KPC8_WICCF|nr:putative protein phosphatase [Wickerhamomyces ciferrii]CCH44042.1 putative protein phosphatase [Wickerhamomyces ciferrii]